MTLTLELDLVEVKTKQHTKNEDPTLTGSKVRAQTHARTHARTHGRTDGRTDARYRLHYLLRLTAGGKNICSLSHG